MSAAIRSEVRKPVVSPFSLHVDDVARMLNFEFDDHPVYDFAELQWFDDDVRGTGMVAFLSRRDGRRVDYYVQPWVRADRDGYEIGGGTGTWTETDFDVARLEVYPDGVDAEARFTDIDGRLIEIRVNDRDGRTRRPGGLLAPISSDIERPASLMLVWMPRFDLVRRGGTAPVIRIDGQDAATGKLPGARLLRRHLIKYAPLVTIEINRAHDGALATAVDGHELHLSPSGGVGELVAEHAGHRARMVLDPPMTDLAELVDGAQTSGRWHVEIDGTRLTGGTWSASRTSGAVAIEMDADEPWKPVRPPWPMRLVTTFVPVFRRWPTTYRWQAELRLGEQPTLSSRWERTEDARGIYYQGPSSA
jgi:hypothetical protein